MIYFSGAMNLYGVRTFRSQTMESKSLEKDAVKIIYDYIEANINVKEFDNKFKTVISTINKNNIVVSKWLQSLIYDFNITDDIKASSDLNYISHSELGYRLMHRLQELRNTNQYTDVIKKDYSKYIVS